MISTTDYTDNTDGYCRASVADANVFKIGVLQSALQEIPGEQIALQLLNCLLGFAKLWSATRLRVALG